MTKVKSRAVALGAVTLAGLLIGGCPPPPPPELVLANETIQVPGTGGSSTVSFRGAAGQTVRITLIGAETALSPYATLQNPDGTSSGKVPALDTALCGANIGETTLPLTGTYSLAVFSGANAGGCVTVTIEVMSG
jgi:hypothetical protein